MMTEKKLIGKIQELRQIKPREDWVVLNKRRILGQPRTLSGLIFDSFRVLPRLFFQYKLAFATLVLVGVLIGTFGFAQNSLPGDYLFPLKRITEKTRAVFVSEEEKPRFSLNLANKRLEELSQIAQRGEVRKLAPAISEFQASVSEAAQKLVQIKEPERSREIGREMIAEVKKLEKQKERVESLGVIVGDTEEIEDVYCQLAGREIESLSIIIEGQVELLDANEVQKYLDGLNQAQKYLEEGKCSLAFEKILLLSQ